MVVPTYMNSSRWSTWGGNPYRRFAGELPRRRCLLFCLRSAHHRRHGLGHVCRHHDGVGVCVLEHSEYFIGERLADLVHAIEIQNDLPESLESHGQALRL